MPSQQTHLIYQFGDFELDGLRRVLLSRPEGKPVEITGRVLEALVYLVERPGQLVDKKTLIEALWPHVVVEEGSLTQTIHTLRKALGEKPGEHRYIATVPGRGYRFVAAVTVREGAKASEPAATSPASVASTADVPAPNDAARSDVAPSRWSKRVLAGGALSLAILLAIALFLLRGHEKSAEQGVAGSTDTPRSIAVLAFVDMSSEQDQEHFAQGLSEEILNSLAQSDELRVIARTSSFSFKSQNADVQSIAQRLGVTHVLEGSVRKSGEKVRITAQLIDGATSAHLWSETYDRNVQDVFGVQTEIATAVAQSLKIKLNSSDAPRRAETTSSQAYEHYLQGRYLFNRRSSSDLLKAKGHFEDAIRIDPDFARAWAALAGVYFVAHHEGPKLPDTATKWREAAERAVALAPDMAEANVRAAQYYWLAVDDLKASSAHMARAEAIDAADPLVISMTLSRAILQGHMDDALEMQRRIVATDPVSATQRGNLGMLLTMTGHLEEARGELERSLELSPASERTTLSIAYVLILQKRTDEALKVIQQLPQGFDRDLGLALAHLSGGDVAEGDAMLSRLLPVGSAAGPDSEAPVGIAEAYVVKNDPDQAFKWLEIARERAQSMDEPLPGKALKSELNMAPFLKPLHSDPRWSKLLASLEGE